MASQRQDALRQRDDCKDGCKDDHRYVTNQRQASEQDAHGNGCQTTVTGRQGQGDRDITRPHVARTAKDLPGIRDQQEADGDQDGRQGWLEISRTGGANGPEHGLQDAGNGRRGIKRKENNRKLKEIEGGLRDTDVLPSGRRSGLKGFAHHTDEPQRMRRERGWKP